MQQIFLLLVLVFLVYGLIRDIWRPSMLFFLALLLLTSAGIIAPDEMLSGFSNSQIATVVLLLIIGNIINQTTIIPALFDKVFHAANTYRRFLSRLMLTVGATSPFMNNTPLVAMLIPYVHDWGQRHGVPPSKLLIPLSYATIAGGMITIFGTSTNLIVNGLLQADQLPVFELFDFAPVGIVVTLFVWAYMMLIGHRLLPTKRDPLNVVKEETLSYVTEVAIDKKSPLRGKTILECASYFKDVNIIGIWRGARIKTPVVGNEVLEPGTNLLVKGDREAIAHLLENTPGIKLPQVPHSDGDSLDLVEVVVSYNSSLAHKTIAETNFKNLYDAQIIAVHRPEENIHSGLSEVVVQPGDVFMVLASPTSLQKFAETTDFYIINREPRPQRIGGWKAWAVGLSFAFILLLNTLGVSSLFVLCLWLGGFYYILRVTSFRTMQRLLDVDLILVLAFSIGLGKAIDNSGLAETVAAHISLNAGSLGVLGSLAAIYLLANVLTQLVSNAASATIVYPIAISVAQLSGADPGMYAMTVAFAASLDFSTPIGYQTNLMIYGPGGYKFTDYLRVGVPLNLSLMVIVLGCIGWMYGLF